MKKKKKIIKKRIKKNHFFVAKTQDISYINNNF